MAAMMHMCEEECERNFQNFFSLNKRRGDSTVQCSEKIDMTTSLLNIIELKRRPDDLHQPVEVVKAK